MKRRDFLVTSALGSVGVGVSRLLLAGIAPTVERLTPNAEDRAATRKILIAGGGYGTAFIRYMTADRENRCGTTRCYTPKAMRTAFVTTSCDQRLLSVKRCGSPGVRRLAAVSSLASLSACGGHSSAEPPPAQVLTSLVVSIAFDSMRIGEAARAKAEGRDQSGGTMRIPDPTWLSSDPSVATVTHVGIVGAVSVGLTRIVATASGKQGDVTVYVIPTPVAGVLLGPNGSVLAPGETKRLVATAVDAAGRPLPDRTVAWLSSDPNVATVTQDGLVAAVAPGVVSVSAISERVYASVDVRVSGPAGPVARVTVNPAAASLTIGQTRQLGVTLEDAEGDLATDRIVTWTSTAPNVATVSATGVVQAIGPGSTIIEAASEGRRGAAGIVVVDPLDAVIIGVADPEPAETVGDTLKIYASARGRHPIATLHARAVNRETDLLAVPAGARGTGIAWVGTLDMRAVRYGPYELVITAVDVNGNQGIVTVPFKRGTREGNGTRIPPRNK